MFQAECTSAIELLKLGTDMTGIIDGFDMLKQEYNGHRTAMLQPSQKDSHNQPAAGLEALMEEVNVMPHWNLVSRQPPVLHMDSQRNGRWISSSHTTEEQTNDEEGFGLKPSYFQKKTRRA